MLWLKLPVQAQDLPRKRLIAASYAASQPDNKLWKKFLQQLAKDRASATVTDEDYYLLRHSLQARTALMEVTLGDDEAFTAGTVQEILEVSKESIRRGLRDELERETSARAVAERDAQTVRQALHVATTSAEREMTSLAAAVKVDRQRVLDEIAKRDEMRRTNRRNRAVAWANRAARIMWVGSIVLLVVGSASTYLLAQDGILRSAIWYVASAIQAALFLFGLASSLWGTSVEGIVRGFEAKMTALFESWLAKASGDDVFENAHQSQPPGPTLP